MAPALIGMIGRKRTGKDSFAKTLVSELGYQAVAFADPLREAALALNPLVGPTSLPDSLVPAHRTLRDVVEAIGWEAAKDTVPHVRRTLQRLGTDAIRSLDDGFWVRAAMARVERLRTIERASGWSGQTIREAGGLSVVVTDCRFPNEAEAIRQAGGVLVRVERPGATAASEEDLHPSETALDGFPEDFVVSNTGTLDDLAGHAREIASYL